MDYLLNIAIENRLQAYPASLLKLGYYLEKQPIIRAFYELHRNLFQYLDLNYYFFANHPNSRAGISEVEKFPYILMPFFLYGFFLLAKRRAINYFILLIFVLIYVAISNQNSAHTFIMYPFIIYPIYISFKQIYETFITK